MAEELEKPHVNGISSTNADIQVDDKTTSLKQQRHGADPDAQEMVIGSLRSQIQDLFSQVNELNNKLVKSYDRVSDLEDDLHVASANYRSSTVKISQLELERTQHMSALNTGLLVEKSHVTTELNRLMEKATEEAAQRGQAESARIAIEKDLDDLSASLFGQANNMVAEARYAQYLSERKVEDAQRALKGAEEAVGSMQSQMQIMQAEKEEVEEKAREMQVVMGKGKWVQRHETDLSRSLKLLSSHAPYQEFLLFAAHLRTLHLTSLNPPAMPTLLPLPFLARLSNEDSDPTVRLDLAPSLNWLSRRSVLAAIHAGQLTIEPIPMTSLFSEMGLHSTPTTVAGINSTNDNVSCALCGSFILTASEQAQNRLQRPPSYILGNYPNPQSWSGSFFKRNSLNSSSHPPSPTHSISPAPISAISSQGDIKQVYIFRLASQPTSTIASLPIPSLQLGRSLSQTNQSATPSSFNATPAVSSQNHQPITIYPLCSSGWCLKRLRATCTLWAFVRTGIVEKVWEEEIPSIPPPSIPAPVTNGEKPPIPPRKRGLWGIASAIGERAASWNETDKDKSKKSIPLPPPPSAPHKPTVQRKLPPPPPPSESLPMHPPTAPHVVPPSLPKRSEGRQRIPIAANGTPNPSNPSTPTKLVFEAALPESPTHATREERATMQPPQRLGTPSSYPLPESRSTSPPSNDVSNPEPLARIASPSIVAAGSAPPPPLPRRAAARAARPIIAGENVSQPATPISPTVAMEPDKKPLNGVEHHDKPSEKKAQDSLTPKNVIEQSTSSEIVTSTGNAKLSDDETQREAGSVDRSTQDSPLSDDVFVDAPSPDKQMEDSIRKSLAKITTEPIGKDDKVTVTKSPATSTNDDGTQKVNKESTGDHQMRDAEAEVDNQVYIGEATWEERTWKELVKLREVMFWARIGGLR